jgi:hypothetical protein
MQLTIETFPIPIKKVISKTLNDPTQLNDKARMIILGIKDNCPNLYEYIKAVK